MAVVGMVEEEKYNVLHKAKHLFYKDTDREEGVSTEVLGMEDEFGILVYCFKTSGE